MAFDEVILKRIERIEESLRRLESMRKHTLEEFVNNWQIPDAVIRNLQVAIEGCADIGNHLIAIKNWETPEDYVSIIEVLGKHRIFPKDFIEVMKNIIKFRNIIVH